MTIVTDQKEIEYLKQGGRIHADIMKVMADMVRPGMTGVELDLQARALLKKQNAKSSFLGYEDYPAVLCVNLNDTIVHGIPTEIPFKEGDIVTVDLGVLYKGFHVDGAWTWGVGKLSKSREAFLKTGRLAHKEAIKQAVAGRNVGDISHAIQKTIEASGYSAVRSLVGHGVGRELHEDPQIPCFGEPKAGELLILGMVLAIEVMYCAHSYELETDSDDQWTIRTSDGGDSALFEHTVIVTQKEPLVLTLYK